jgi:hypothetical protein
MACCLGPVRENAVTPPPPPPGGKTWRQTDHVTEATGRLSHTQGFTLLLPDLSVSSYLALSYISEIHSCPVIRTLSMIKILSVILYIFCP